MSGLLVDGRDIRVPGLDIVNHNDAPECKLDPGDRARRKSPWIRQLVIHTTQGKWPQPIRIERGPGGTAARTAEFWHRDPVHSGAHLIVDNDGTIWCLADLSADAAHHATTCNDWSIGIEMRQEPDGSIHEIVLDTTVRLARAICDLSFDDRTAGLFAIPWQVVGDTYRTGEIVERLRHGGPDWAGILGHRDQAWMFPEWLPAVARARHPHGYSARGRGDPGDEIYHRLITAGCEPFRLDAREDLAAWMHRQARLKSWGQPVLIDGRCGAGTIAAMRRIGMRHGREIDAAVEDPRG